MYFRFYPLLVATRINSFFINLTCLIYILIDFGLNVYKYGECEGISSEFAYVEKSEAEKYVGYFIAYKIMFALPFSVFSSFILVKQLYKTFIIIMDFIFKRFNHYYSVILKRKSKDSFCCTICNVDDDNEIFYSQYDLNYVLRLINKKNYETKSMEKIKKSVIKNLEAKYKYSEIVEINQPKKLIGLFKRFIYDWKDHFRFSSRFVNSVVVAFVTLYYFFIIIAYSAARLTSTAFDTINEFIMGLDETGVQNKYYLKFKEIKDGIPPIFIVPIFVALFICLFQLFLLIRETKAYLLDLYKGKCDFVTKNISNQAIAGSSFSFGG